MSKKKPTTAPTDIVGTFLITHINVERGQASLLLEATGPFDFSAAAKGDPVRVMLVRDE